MTSSKGVRVHSPRPQNKKHAPVDKQPEAPVPVVEPEAPVPVVEQDYPPAVGEDDFAEPETPDAPEELIAQEEATEAPPKPETLQSFLQDMAENQAMAIAYGKDVGRFLVVDLEGANKPYIPLKMCGQTELRVLGPGTPVRFLVLGIICGKTSGWLRIDEIRRERSRR